MSLPLPKDSPKGYFLTIRILTIILPSNFPSKTLVLRIKFEKSSWESSIPTNSDLKIHLRQTHTFEVSEISPMYIGVFYKSGLFSEDKFCSCLVKTENFSCKKGIKYTEVSSGSDKVQIYWTFVIEEDRKVDNPELIKMINEVEAEREEVRYRKNKIKGKLMEIKEKRKHTKEEINNLIQNIQPILGSLEKYSWSTPKEKRSYDSRTYDPSRPCVLTWAD